MSLEASVHSLINSWSMPFRSRIRQIVVVESGQELSRIYNLLFGIKSALNRIVYHNTDLESISRLVVVSV